MSDNVIKAFQHIKGHANQNISDRDLYRNFFNELDEVIEKYFEAGMAHELMISAVSLHHHILCQGWIAAEDDE